MIRTINLIIILLVSISFSLGYSIFFGDNSYTHKKSLVSNNNIQHIKNNQLKSKNDILIFEIQSAQSSDEHVENFARERLGLSYPDEEFIIFEKKKDDEN
jgi:cell division protein FtsB